MVQRVWRALGRCLPPGARPHSGQCSSAKTSDMSSSSDLVSGRVAGPLSSAQPRLDHLGIAVHSLGESIPFYRQLGLQLSGCEEIPHEHVRVAMFQVGESRIELLEPTAADSAVGRFLARRGPGLHHVALRVTGLEALRDRLVKGEVRLVGGKIQKGAGGHRYLFVHPESAGGVLLELVEAK